MTSSIEGRRYWPQLWAQKNDAFILHFNISKTITPGSLLSKKITAESINKLLARQYKSCWDQNITSSISYYDYIKYHDVPGCSNDPAVKRLRQKKYASFLCFLRETGHPLFSRAQRSYDTLSKSLNQSNGIFPSLYYLIAQLESMEVDYHIIFHTQEGGHDVLSKIENKLKREIIRSNFKNGILKIPYYATQKSTEHITIQKITFENTEIKDCNFIFDFLKHNKFTAIENKRGEGMFCPIDKNDLQTHHIFFQNIGRKSRIDLHPLKGSALSAQETERLFCKVNPVHALADIHYFIDRLNESLFSPTPSPKRESCFYRILNLM